MELLLDLYGFFSVILHAAELAGRTALLGSLAFWMLLALPLAPWLPPGDAARLRAIGRGAVVWSAVGAIGGVAPGIGGVPFHAGEFRLRHDRGAAAEMERETPQRKGLGHVVPSCPTERHCVAERQFASYGSDCPPALAWRHSLPRVAPAIQRKSACRKRSRERFASACLLLAAALATPPLARAEPAAV